VQRATAELEVGGPRRIDAGTVEIPVRYDGPDLAEVATLTGLRPEEVIALHTGSRWTVAFAGFAPGFGYLTGGDPRLDVPRRDSPRTRIPAGSVGLAGRFSGVYPSESPGGWQLIGSTTERMWDLDRPEPALLVPGVEVIFKAVDR
jgi:KipI family sensor histidine kinase inhibitor